MHGTHGHLLLLLFCWTSLRWYVLPWKHFSSLILNKNFNKIFSEKCRIHRWKSGALVYGKFYPMWSRYSSEYDQKEAWHWRISCHGYCLLHVSRYITLSSLCHCCDIAPACRSMISQRCQNHPNLSKIFLHDIFDGIRKISFWHWNEHDFYYHLIKSYCNLRSEHVVYIPVQIINEWLFKVLSWIPRPYPRNDSNWSCRRKFQFFFCNIKSIFILFRRFLKMTSWRKLLPMSKHNSQRDWNHNFSNSAAPNRRINYLTRKTCYEKSNQETSSF